MCVISTLVKNFLKKHQLHIEFDDFSSIVCTIQMYGALWALSEGEDEGYNLCARSKVNPLSDEFNENYLIACLQMRTKNCL